MSTDFCADLSLDLGEPMAGTAPEHTDRWLLIEYDGRWEPKAFEHSELSLEVKRHVAKAVKARPGTRIQLIRRPRPADDDVTVMVVRSMPGGLARRDFVLRSHEELLDLDLVAALDAESHARPDPLYLVCTHGKRDRCCALYGNRVYAALMEVAPDHTWQASHLGGHRFAAVVLALPEGLMYGRIQPDDIEELVSDHETAQVFDLDKLRGRTAWSRPAQAAEIALRRRIGAREIDEIEVVAETPERVILLAGGAEFEVGLTRRMATGQAPPSCGKDPEVPEWWEATVLHDPS